MSTAVEARRPGMKAWLTLIQCEAKMVARDTAGLVVPIGLPLLSLVMSASSAGDEVISNGMTALDLFVLPLVLTMVIAIVGIINMPSFLSYYRRTGILRRLSVTPASPTMVLIAQVIVSVIQTVIGLAVAVAVAFIGFGANVPTNLAAALGVYLLTMAAMYAIGMIVAAIAPTPNSAVAIGLVTFFAFGALGGMFGGPDALPDFLASIGEWLPFGAAVDALAAAWAGTAVEMSSLISLGATTVLGVLVAAVLFRWD
ncbi:ABC-2 type transport system permease protein [Actinoalloteichus hoggarensis]|uniref:Transport permease protein n=1 Tax=Actinoalloteichus hoggarensis TaxID=1470176 RepID=A0A221W9W1_9PSEU|nr:ABC transporter permease [Actinoalloteichus hoggarensis]ASO22625.1 ABC-2 type transporter [Actinoalloteichus hoggarensis]MBB5924232.1 ABC-2 type transport system permease protein [Actinoalloteichus hoggarensis]